MAGLYTKVYELLLCSFKVDPCAVPYDGNSRNLSYHITVCNSNTTTKDKKEAFEFGIHPEDVVSFQHSYSSPFQHDYISHNELAPRWTTHDSNQGVNSISFGMLGMSPQAL
ncbi:hypothetical protein CEXT_670731 [Caerostris extrusa]|uniref:Uncharacterized protein n=1 Tax=Caerostris extrusa TaxID=172846 RepID=A0AAV4U7C0_CAEEX|nr:hypothetical protein CEXT_670731 [Caerostris extrusa]